MRVVAAADGKRLDELRVRILKALDGALGDGYHAFRVREKEIPGGRELHGARRPAEELDVQLRLKGADLVRDGGLRDVQRLSRAGEIEVLGNREKTAQLERIHGDSSLFPHGIDK